MIEREESERLYVKEYKGVFNPLSVQPDPI